MARQSFPPEPDRPLGIPIHPPVVYVAPSWEYRHVVRELTVGAPGEAELDALGAEGWELAAAFTWGDAAHLYFKRERD
jgi:hypothetical protein